MLVLSACSGGDSDSGDVASKQPGGTTTAPRGGNAIATQPVASDKGLARIDLMSVDRSTANTVLVRFRMVNEDKETISPLADLNHPDTKGGFSADGITLIDAVNNKRYFPLMSTNQSCLCSSLDGLSIEPGQGKDLFALLPAPPASLQRVTVSVPLTPAFIDVPIGAGPVRPTEMDPTQTSLQPPKVLPLISTVEGDEQSLDEDDRNQKVRLSTDVLFALNKADLTPRARSALQSVAQRINVSPGNQVTIDGYTDTSGNDAINQPLSERRAQAVETELKGFVTRQGVTYKSAGHGSADPVADNGTEAGRRKNRRVTVTFARPAPPKPTPPPAAPAPSAPAAHGKLPVIATAQPQSAEVQSTKLEINALRRESSGLVALTWTVTNTGSESFNVAGRFLIGGSSYQGGTTAGVTLFDESKSMHYFTLRDADRFCVCSDFIGTGRTVLDPGENVTLYDLYKLPSDMTAVSVEIPQYAVTKSVPIS